MVLKRKASKQIAKIAVKSEYELLREGNIIRNQKFLDLLGIQEVKPTPILRSRRQDDSDDDYESVSTSHSSEDSASDDDSDTLEDKRGRRLSRKAVSLPQISKKRKRQSTKRIIQEPTRRSSRKTGVPTDDQVFLQLRNTDGRAVAVHSSRQSAAGNDDTMNANTERQKVTAKSLREFISNNSTNHNNIVSNATIGHCVDRLNSMSEKALTSRVKTIAKANGKNSKEKLLCTYYALKAAQLVDIADLCFEAVQNS